jgi:hypothetical protein
VEPVFTATAYSSFYAFYRLHQHTKNGTIVHQDLYLLNATVVHAWGYSVHLLDFMKSHSARDAGIVLGKNTKLITDIDVHNGGLFGPNGARNYDVVIVGFSEYVTAQEYAGYKRFVATGGNLLIVSADNFMVEVAYSPNSNKLALVSGHSWTFNGTAAWRGPHQRWYAENSNWVGSNYGIWLSLKVQFHGATPVADGNLGDMLLKKFGSHVFTGYVHHEENIITNSSDRAIAYWDIAGLSNGEVVAVYTHSYGKGSMLHLGIFGDDVIAKDPQLQFLVIKAIANWAANPSTKASTPVISIPSSSSIAASRSHALPSIWTYSAGDNRISEASVGAAFGAIALVLVLTRKR